MSSCSSTSLNLNYPVIATYDSSTKLNEHEAATHDTDEENSTGYSSNVREVEENFTESQNTEKRRIEVNPTSRKGAEFDLNFPISTKRAKFDLNCPYLDLNLSSDEIFMDEKSDVAQYSRDVKVKAEVNGEEDRLTPKLGLPGLYRSPILSTT